MDFDHVMKGDPAYTEPQARVGRHPQDNLSALINQYAALSLNSGSKTPRAPRVATDFDMLYNLVVDHLLSSLKEAHHKYRSTQAEVEKCEDALEEYADDPESENYLGERINLEFSILDFERAKKNLEEIQLTLDMAGMRDLESMIYTHESPLQSQNLPPVDVDPLSFLLNLFGQLRLSETS